ncbi:MAG: hypothetical protein QNJ63_16605 [Calothrix sp. MO_192.B10]|nr:hypothetical protein [Calothrix sp. MO_192.B10]
MSGQPYGNDQKIDKILDILSKKKSLTTKFLEFSEKLFIPILLGILAFITSQAGNKISKTQTEIALSQLEMAKSQYKANLQVKYIELFYQDITSQNVQKQRDALSFLELIELDEADPLVEWAENRVKPEVKPQLEEARQNIVSRQQRVQDLQKVNDYKIQIFYNEKRPEQRRIAVEIKNALKNAEVRSVIEVKPQLDKASSDQIRYFPKDESEVAKALKRILDTTYPKRSFNLQEVYTPSKGAVSIFLKTES